jgi:hypothetical protein
MPVPEVKAEAMADREPIDSDFLLKELRKLLPGPVREEKSLDGSVVLVGGDPGEAIVRVGRKKLSIAVYSVRWEGPHTPTVKPQHLATLSWRRLPATTLLMTLHGLARAAKDIRTATYRRCERCGETKPPEWMHDGSTCQSCAERHLGVVY